MAMLAFICLRYLLRLCLTRQSPLSQKRAQERTVTSAALHVLSEILITSYRGYETLSHVSSARMPVTHLIALLTSEILLRTIRKL